MRKSAAVTLTLVPLLAASAMAYAQAPGMTDPSGTPATVPLQWLDTAPAALDPVLSPPGMTPSIDELDCDVDPNSDLRDDCKVTDEDDYRVWSEGGVVRGGYGGYWTGGHGG